MIPLHNVSSSVLQFMLYFLPFKMVMLIPSLSVLSLPLLWSAILWKDPWMFSSVLCDKVRRFPHRFNTSSCCLSICILAVSTWFVVVPPASQSASSNSLIFGIISIFDSSSCFWGLFCSFYSGLSSSAFLIIFFFHAPVLLVSLFPLFLLDCSFFLANVIIFYRWNLRLVSRTRA